jgi:hypothetical protein
MGSEGLGLEFRSEHDVAGSRHPTPVQPAAQGRNDSGHAQLDARPQPVVFIAGIGRSGSTLLDRMLGQATGWFSVGEVVHLWTRGLMANERCACGVIFRDCPVWSEIGKHAFGGWEQVDPMAINHMRLAVERDRHIPLLLYPRLRPGFLEDVMTYTELISRVYEAARVVTGASVIVDSSKHVPAALALRLNPGLDLRVVHLVRDSRGVAYSWSKAVSRPATSGETLMTRWSPVETSLRYLAYNTLLSRIFADEALQVRYEDLVANPRAIAGSIIEWLGLGPDGLESIKANGSVAFGTSHGISGNPMRFTTGPVDLAVDDEWMRSMSVADRFLVTLLTFPSLMRYRYHLRPEVRRAPGS